MVRDVRFELPTSCSQMWRPTNWATPGYSLFCHDTTASGKNKAFSVCGHLCGQRRFCVVFSSWGKTSKRPCCKDLRRFALPCPGYRHGTPKPGAIPMSLYPNIHFFAMIPRRGENQSFFCLWSFMWSKPLLCRFRQLGKVQQTQVSQGLTGFRLDLSRIQLRHSQSRRTTPGYSVS